MHFFVLFRNIGKIDLYCQLSKFHFIGNVLRRLIIFFPSRNIILLLISCIYSFQIMFEKNAVEEGTCNGTPGRKYHLRCCWMDIGHPSVHIIAQRLFYKDNRVRTFRVWIVLPFADGAGDLQVFGPTAAVQRVAAAGLGRVFNSQHSTSRHGQRTITK